MIFSDRLHNKVKMPESVEANRESALSDSVEFDRKPMEILLEVPKKELTSNPPVLLPAARRRRSAAGRNTVKTKEPEVVARRNARERRRVKLVNDGFLRLRKHVPTDPKNKKLSKVKTLRSAIEYIRHLQQLLNQATKNSNLQLSDFAKLDVLQGATVNTSNSWFSNLDLPKKENQGQEYKDFEDAFFTPPRILPRAPLQL